MLSNCNRLLQELGYMCIYINVAMLLISDCDVVALCQFFCNSHVKNFAALLQRHKVSSAFAQLHKLN